MPVTIPDPAEIKEKGTISTQPFPSPVASMPEMRGIRDITDSQ